MKTSFVIRKTLFYIFAILSLLAFIYVAGELSEDVAMQELMSAKLIGVSMFILFSLITAILYDPKFLLRQLAAILCVSTAIVTSFIPARSSWARNIRKNYYRVGTLSRLYSWALHRYDTCTKENDL